MRGLRVALDGEIPDDVANERVLVELNTDFSTKGVSGALSHDTMTDLFRRGEVLPEGRSTEEEVRLIWEGQLVVAVK